jgi:hypothetical protein
MASKQAKAAPRDPRRKWRKIGGVAASDFTHELYLALCMKPQTNHADIYHHCLYFWSDIYVHFDIRS